MENLFGEQTVQLEEKKLQEIANHILDLKRVNPDLLNGHTIGQINRKVTLAIYLDSGLLPILQSGDKDKFSEWFLSKEAPTEEEIARAIRKLSQIDAIRLPREAVIKAEFHRQHMGHNLSKRG
jgi:hypothetical protein